MNSTRKILIIENDHDARVAYRRTLEDKGYTVITTTSGKSALEILSKNQPVALILINMNLPVIGGAEFLQIKRADPKITQIPVIALSNGDLTEQVEAILRAPVDLAQLTQTIQKFI